MVAAHSIDLRFDRRLQMYDPLPSEFVDTAAQVEMLEALGYMEAEAGEDDP